MRMIQTKMISIIIPTYNDAKNLALCLKSIRECDYNGRYEIIVFNDCSTDDTEKIAESYGCKVINSKTNVGPGIGRNTAAKEAAGDILAFTDSDCVVHSDWLKLIDEIFRDLQIFAVNGKYSESMTPQFIAKFRMYESSFHVYQEKRFVNHASSNNIACRKEIFLKSGGFGNRYIAEDMVFGYNLSKIGVSILLVPELKVLHHCKTTIKDYLKQQYIWLKNTVDVHINYPETIYSKWPIKRGLLIYQLIVQILLIPVIFMSFFYPFLLLLFLLGLISLFVMNYPFLIYVMKKESNSFFALAKAFYIIILRNYTWILGTISGVKNFKNFFILSSYLLSSKFKKQNV